MHASGRQLSSAWFPGHRTHEDAEPRLVAALGLPYSNKYLSNQKANSDSRFAFNGVVCNGLEWRLLRHLGRLEMKDIHVMSTRSIALNSYDGSYAMILYNETVPALQIPHLCVFEPRGSFGYDLKCCCPMTTSGSSYLEGIENSRLRFVKNHIFFYEGPQEQTLTLHYKITVKIGDGGKRFELQLVDWIHDDYITQAQPSDMDVLCDPDMLVFIFSDWIGLYKFDMESDLPSQTLKWFHAIRVSHPERRSLRHCTHGFCMVTQDHAPSLWQDGPESIESLNGQDDIDYSRIGLGSEYNRYKGVIERKSHKYYVYLSAGESLIAFHPTMANYDYMNTSRDIAIDKNSLFCVSKQFGVFYTNPKRTIVYNSIMTLAAPNRIIVDFRAKTRRRNLRISTSIRDLSFDESYGVSGRLLLICQKRSERGDLQLRVNRVNAGKRGNYCMKQLISYNDLKPLETELTRYAKLSKNAMKTMNKRFNLIVAVYEYLYGNEMIEEMIDSQCYQGKKPTCLLQSFHDM